MLLVCAGRVFFVCDGHLSIGCVLVGRVWGGGGGPRGGGGGGFVVVVGQDMGAAAAASSFALLLCSVGSPWFRSSLAGASRGQVVAVLVLGPKPQPLLVLLLWFFGPLLPRATWDKRENKREMVLKSVSPPALFSKVILFFLCQSASPPCHVIRFSSKCYMTTKAGLPAENSGQLSQRLGGPRRPKAVCVAVTCVYLINRKSV